MSSREEVNYLQPPHSGWQWEPSNKPLFERADHRVIPKQTKADLHHRGSVVKTKIAVESSERQALINNKITKS
jgi:hypothetical protein